METIIETKNLTKFYGKDCGIADVSLTVNKGDVFGFLGPNGSGKSTTIRTLLDLIRPSSGSASIFGLDCHKDALEIHKHISYVPGDVNMYGSMTGEKFLSYFGRIRGEFDRAAAYEYARRFDVRLDKKLKEYSKGNRQKIALIQAFMSNTKLIILDEPTSGLDPLVQQTFLNIVREEANKGRTIFFSSHVLSEVEKICNRLAIIKEGRIVTQEKIEDLQKKSGKILDVKFNNNITQDALNIEGISSIMRSGNHLQMIVTGNVKNVLKEISNWDLLDITIRPMSLEDIFMQYYS